MIVGQKNATCCKNLSQRGLTMEIRGDFYLDNEEFSDIILQAAAGEIETKSFPTDKQAVVWYTGNVR